MPLSLFLLGDMDSNHDSLLQRQMSYRWTISQIHLAVIKKRFF